MPNPRVRSRQLAGDVPITVLLSTDEVGGHERMLIEWLACAREFGLRPTLFCRPNRDLINIVESSGLPWHKAPYVAHRGGLLDPARWRNFLHTMRTAAKAPAQAPVLLAPGSMRVPVLEILACSLAGRHIVCYVPMTHDSLTLRERWPRVRDWLTRRLASRIAMWITITDEQARALVSFWRVGGTVHIVPNRLGFLSAPPTAPRGGSSPVSVVYVGRFSSNQKGLDWLADLLEKTPEWLSGYRFTFQGGGHFGTRLQALADRLGPARVRVLPWGDTTETLAQADVLILTSRFEGLPLVAIEAVWAGVPVVATRESGLTDVLQESCLFPFGDASGFQSALELMRSQANREQAVAHAREKLRALLSEERYRESLRELTEELARVAS